MRPRNDGHGEANALRNQFTKYVEIACSRQKIAYLRERTYLSEHEMVTDFDDAFAQLLAAPEQMLEDNIALSQALNMLSKKELYIFLTRSWEGRSFAEIAARCGVTYKGITATYYRILQKLRRELR